MMWVESCHLFEPKKNRLSVNGRAHGTPFIFALDSTASPKTCCIMCSVVLPMFSPTSPAYSPTTPLLCMGVPDDHVTYRATSPAISPISLDLFPGVEDHNVEYGPTPASPAYGPMSPSPYLTQDEQIEFNPAATSPTVDAGNQDDIVGEYSPTTTASPASPVSYQTQDDYIESPTPSPSPPVDEIDEYTSTAPSRHAGFEDDMIDESASSSYSPSSPPGSASHAETGLLPPTSLATTAPRFPAPVARNSTSPTYSPAPPPPALSPSAFSQTSTEVLDDDNGAAQQRQQRRAEFLRKRKQIETHVYPPTRARMRLSFMA